MRCFEWTSISIDLISDTAWARSCRYVIFHPLMDFISKENIKNAHLVEIVKNEKHNNTIDLKFRLVRSPGLELPIYFFKFWLCIFKN